MTASSRASIDGASVLLVSDESAAAERAVLVAFLTVRALHLIQGGICMATGWRAYRRPRLALLALVAATAEASWMARRCWPQRCYAESLPAWVDTASGVVGLLAISAATYPADRTAWVNWVCPLTFGTAAGAAVGARKTARVSTSLLAGTYLATVWSSVREGGSLLATAAANTTSYGGYHLAISRYVSRLRSDAETLHRARAEALEQRGRAEAEAERNRQHRLLHDSALQTLELLAGDWQDDVGVMRGRARQEAGRLRRALAGLEPERGLGRALASLVDEYRTQGLSIELVSAELISEPAPDASAALAEATRELLTNVVKHSGASRVVIRVANLDGAVRLTVRDHGRGFDPQNANPGFGLEHSVRDRLRDVGGSTEMWSVPGRGTRITLSVPT